MPDEMNVNQITDALLAEIQKVLDTYVVFPSPEARDSVVLWIAHAWVFECFESTPRLSIRSTEYGSGKSRVLEMCEHMTPNPMNAVSLTPSVLWRSMEHNKPTLLLDECDTIFGKNGSASSHMYLRGVINAGHRKNSTVPRCVGTEEVKQFSVFGVIAMAGVGRLPDSIATRSVEIIMRRRCDSDPKVKPFRLKFAQDNIDRIKALLAGWAKLASPELSASMPEMPVTDRKADVWEPLVAIADLASEAWGARARKACVLLTTESLGKPTSLGVQLLQDIRAVFGGRDKMFTHEIISRVLDLDDSVWTPAVLDGRRMARHLDEYDVHSTMLRIGSKTGRGYTLAEFSDAWSRYCPTTETELIEA